MKDQSWLEFKGECTAYFSTLNVGSLRSYAREVGVAKPTTKRKDCLIEEILAIFSGDLQPVPRTKHGAPVKENGVNLSLIKQEVGRIRLRCYGDGADVSADEACEAMPENVLQVQAEDAATFDFKKELQRLRESNASVFRVEDAASKESKMKRIHESEVFAGQLENSEDLWFLLPLDCTGEGPKVLVPQELVTENDLRKGDVVSCYARKGSTASVATEILMINDRMKEDLQRRDFDTADSIAPTKKIKLCGEANNALSLKYADWLLPLGRGQRGLIVSAPKVGKTTLLFDVAEVARKNNPDLEVFALLVEQSPETVGEFRKILRRNNLVYTAYGEDPEKQVFAARFLLQRAKRFAECGRDVLLLADSLNALAYAFNDTEESVGGKRLSGGMESKTVQFMKRFFGTARNLEGGGSLTILGTVCSQTGNPADDLLCSELSALANYEMRLDERAAAKRMYPAIDFFASQIKQIELLFSAEEQAIERTVRGWKEETDAGRKIEACLSASDDYETFAAEVRK